MADGPGGSHGVQRALGLRQHKRGHARKYTLFGTILGAVLTPTHPHCAKAAPVFHCLGAALGRWPGGAARRAAWEAQRGFRQ